MTKYVLVSMSDDRDERQYIESCSAKHVDLTFDYDRALKFSTFNEAQNCRRIILPDIDATFEIKCKPDKDAAIG
jgi:hypothetical protein